MSSSINGNAGPVVQYLESSMSDKLLRKFPDNSTLDFDYSQSALWSPPIVRFHQLYQAAGAHILTPKSNSKSSAKRRLSFDSDRRKKKKITFSKIKKKINSFALSFDLPKRRLGFNANGESGSHSPTANRKGWEKVLKVASKQFKRKKKDPTVHVKLSDYLRSRNF